MKWALQLPAPAPSSAAISPDGTIYVTDKDGGLHAISPKGSQEWVFYTWSAAVGGQIHSSPVVDANGAIYFGNDAGAIFSVTPGGNLRWKFVTGGYVGSSPTVGPDGTLYIGSYDHDLYALRSAGGTASSTTVGSSSTSTTNSLSTIATTAASECPGFAYTQNSTLMLCGYPFRFMGGAVDGILANYLGLPFAPGSLGVSDPATRIAQAKQYGMNVFEFWLNLQSDLFGYSYVGTSMGNDTFATFWKIYNEQPTHATYFQALDRLITDAKRNHVYLVPGLTVSYTRWDLMGNGTDFFKVGSASNLLWKEFVGTVVSRYRNESQILFWDLAGEPDNSLCYGIQAGAFPPQFASDAYSRSVAELSGWANDTYSYVKGLDSNHLIEGGWNIPLYACGGPEPQTVQSQLKTMDLFRTFDGVFDLTDIHVYDVNIQQWCQYANESCPMSYSEAASELVQRYATYSHDVLKKPFLLDNWGSQWWVDHYMGIGYSPNPLTKYLLQDMVKYRVDGSFITWWEETPGNLFVSPQETPEVTNWLKYYSGLLTATNNQITTTTSSTVSTTASSATSGITTASQSSSTSSTTGGVTATSTSQTVTQSSSSSTTGGGGIPEYPYQEAVASIFAVLIVASYLLARRHGTSIKPSTLQG